MLAAKLMEKLQMAVSDHGNLPVLDRDNDEISIITIREAETMAYRECPLVVSMFPVRIILKQ